MRRAKWWKIQKAVTSDQLVKKDEITYTSRETSIVP
jgi:hypothetical protein